MVNRGQKVCSECNTPNGVRAYECKKCNHPFKMKRRRRTPRKVLVEDHKELLRGDVVTVIGGSGSYYEDEGGEKHYLTERGKYKVITTDDNGVRVRGEHGFGYLYMGQTKTGLVNSITKCACKLMLIQPVRAGL